MTEVEKIARGLTEAMKVVWTHERFDPKGWEPSNIKNPLVESFVALGLAEIKDGRCGFERFKDSMLVPTPLGLAVRQYLQEQSQ